MLQSSVQVRRRTECRKKLTVASNCSCVKDKSSISLMTEVYKPCKGARGIVPWRDFIMKDALRLGPAQIADFVTY